MKVTKIAIKEMYGIEEIELDGKDIELRGGTGAGKTSILDAIKVSLTNKSDRPYVIKQGATEGSILVSLDNGVEINRTKKQQGNDVSKITKHGTLVDKPQSFLNEIFTELQLNPIEFATWDEKKQNREVLNTIEFEWSIDWIKEEFGEIPKGINYDQHILQVLNDIQAKNGNYYQEREEVNRKELFKRQAIVQTAETIPSGYDVDKWSKYDLTEKITEMNKLNRTNDEIRRAKDFIEAQSNKKRGLQADKEIKINALKEGIQAEKNGLSKTIERLKSEILLAEQQISNLDNSIVDKEKLIISEHETALAKLDADLGVAEEYASKVVVDTTELNQEIQTATKMKEYVSEFRTMQAMEEERIELKERSDYLTQQIQKARDLPGKILKTAKLPIDDLTVVDGKPLVKGLPINNLSDGEKIGLCVDISLNQKHNLEMILLNGVEQLDDESREKLYAKCKAKGLQIIAARTTNDSELTVVEL